jgi:hypothetical protein
MKTTFKELTQNKPSLAVKAMIEGLRKAKNRSDFKIDMSTFGASEDGICFGCAATCAVAQLTGKNLPPKIIDETLDAAKWLGVELEDMESFEAAIDGLRRGT